MPPVFQWAVGEELRSLHLRSTSLYLLNDLPSLETILLELLFGHNFHEINQTLSPFSLTQPCRMDHEDGEGTGGRIPSCNYWSGCGGSRRHQMVTWVVTWEGGTSVAISEELCWDSERAHSIDNAASSTCIREHSSLSYCKPQMSLEWPLATRKTWEPCPDPDL